MDEYLGTNDNVVMPVDGHVRLIEMVVWSIEGLMRLRELVVG
jgi:hypothetical protein